MILAAGRGERLRPLTDTLPKPLITVGQRCLIEHHIHNLAGYGFKNIIINIAYLPDLIENKLGNGHRYGVKIRYSKEPHGALGTGGGIVNALPLIGSENFVLINGDIYTDFAFDCLKHALESQAHLIMVKNPEHNIQGDFVLQNNLVQAKQKDGLSSVTFSGIGVYQKKLFYGYPNRFFPLTDVLAKAIQCNQVSAELHDSIWVDVGTLDRLQLARELENSRCGART